MGLGVVTLSAHDFSQSESALEIGGRTVRARIRVNLLEIAGVDANLDGRVSYEELDRAIERVFAALKEHYLLRAPNVPEHIVAEQYEIGDEHVLQIVVTHTFGYDVRRLDVTSRFDALFAPTHQHLVSAIVNGEPLRAVLDASNRTVTFEISRLNPRTIATTVAAALGLLLLAVYRSRSRSPRP
jgi:hypothetical protein